MLRTASQRSNIKVRDIAEDIVAWVSGAEQKGRRRPQWLADERSKGLSHPTCALTAGAATSGWRGSAGPADALQPMEHQHRNVVLDVLVAHQGQQG
jgi:hypothetical protein